MRSTQQALPAQAGFPAILLAALVAAGWTCGIAFLFLFLREVYQYYSLERLISSAQLRDYPRSTGYLRDIYSPPAPFSWFRSGNSMQREREYAALTTMLDAAGAVEAGGASQAAAMIATLVEDRRKRGLLIEQLKRRSVNLEQIVRDLENTGELEDQRNDTERELGRLKKWNAQLEKSLVDIAAQFGSRLSLEPELQDGRAVFYLGGVLRGLPRVKGIPDNLENMISFKEKLAAAGGKVEIDAPDAQQVFQKFLGETREAAVPINVELKSSINRSIDLEAELLGLKAEIEVKREDFYRTVNGVSVELSRRHVPSRLAEIKGFFQNLISL